LVEVVVHLQGEVEVAAVVVVVPLMPLEQVLQGQLVELEPLAAQPNLPVHRLSLLSINVSFHKT
jgi:hypothetical protein